MDIQTLGPPYGIVLDMDMDDRIIGTGFPEIRGRVGVFSYGEKQDTSTDDPPYKTCAEDRSQDSGVSSQ